MRPPARLVLSCLGSRIALGLLLASVACTSPGSAGSGDSSTGGSAGDGTATAPTTADPDGGPGPDDDGSTAGPVTATSGGSDTTMGRGDATGTDTGDPPAACPVTHTCLQAPPEGWTGPVNVQDMAAGELLNDCAGAYPELVEEHPTDPAGDPASCSCSCGNVSGASCTYRIGRFAQANCGGIGSYTNLPVLDDCVDNANSMQTWWSLEANPQGGSCNASSNEEIVPLEFQRQIRVCQGVPLDQGCAANEICAPIPSQPFLPDICIYQAGEHECPAGAYSERTVHYTGAEDTRDCSPACTCAAPAGSCTGVTATMYRDSDTCTAGGTCFNPPCLHNKTQGCSQVDISQTRSIRRTAGATYSGSCADQGFDPVGEVTPTEPVTVCCAP